MKARQIRGLREQVREILKEHEDARNSDRFLTCMLWKVHYVDIVQDGINGDWVYLKDILALPSEDAVSRCRRQIQHDDQQYPPTSEAVAKARGWNIEEWKRALGYAPMFKEALF